MIDDFPKIPEARRLVVKVLKFGSVDASSRRTLEQALELMVRDKAYRRATPRPVKITSAIKREVKRLADTTDMTMHQISEQVGLHNIGRVSEIVNGKR